MLSAKTSAILRLATVQATEFRHGETSEILRHSAQQPTCWLAHRSEELPGNGRLGLVVRVSQRTAADLLVSPQV